MLKGWAPARFRLRHDARSRIAAGMLVVLVVAITTGSAMAAVAGARRSNTAYQRFLTWSHDPEISFSGCDCDARQLYEEFDRIRSQPFVEDSARYGFGFVVPRLPDGGRPSFLALQPAIDLDDRLGRDLLRFKMLEGRLPAPTAPDETSIGFIAAERFGLEVGDSLDLTAFDDADSVVASVHVVGIHAAPGELPSATGPQGSTLLLTSA